MNYSRTSKVYGTRWFAWPPLWNIFTKKIRLPLFARNSIILTGRRFAQSSILFIRWAKFSHYQSLGGNRNTKVKLGNVWWIGEGGENDGEQMLLEVEGTEVNIATDHFRVWEYILYVLVNWTPTSCKLLGMLSILFKLVFFCTHNPS